MQACTKKKLAASAPVCEKPKLFLGLPVLTETLNYSTSSCPLLKFLWLFILLSCWLSAAVADISCSEAACTCLTPTLAPSSCGPFFNPRFHFLVSGENRPPRLQLLQATAFSRKKDLLRCFACFLPEVLFLNQSGDTTPSLGGATKNLCKSRRALADRVDSTPTWLIPLGATL